MSYEITLLRRGARKDWAHSICILLSQSSSDIIMRLMSSSLAPISREKRFKLFITYTVNQTIYTTQSDSSD